MTDFDEVREQLELLRDEELVSILEEHDEEQWRPEVFDIVASILSERGVAPNADLKQEGDASEEEADMDLVAVGNYFSYIDAETDRLALEAKGLKAWIFNEYGPPMQGFGPAVQLRVRTEDLAAARGILESEPVSSSELPPDIAEPPCPRCGSRKVAEEAEVLDALDASTSASTKETWFYHCASCGHKWSES
jgi:DNA-directed RNA polymerase subunit M/transcription elongation factor TFIIS